MAPLDAGPALPDISAEEPTGPSLEFDAAFGELERVVQGKAEQQFGSLIVPAEEPDWKDAVARARELMERTYDLRVMSHLAVGRLALEGLAGFAAALTPIRQILETRWEKVHPQLDPEDDNDPMLRSNALLRLAEPKRVLKVIRDLPLAKSPRTGVVSWRDISLATGAIEAEGDAPKMTEAVILGTFRDADPATLAALRDAVSQATADAAGITEAFEAAAGYGTGPDLGELVKLLRDVKRYFDKYSPAADELAPEAESAADASEAPAAGGAAPARAGGASIASINSVGSRADAMRLLDLVMRYYEIHEPSSPLPLLIGRARRLADKGFMELLADLAPDGLSQVKIITGPQEEV